jgi:hypothetical protein
VREGYDFIVIKAWMGYNGRENVLNSKKIFKTKSFLAKIGPTVKIIFDLFTVYLFQIGWNEQNNHLTQLSHELSLKSAKSLN